MNQHPLPNIKSRAARHAALGDPTRLALVDELVTSDRSPTELRELLNIESNLLSHHLDVLAEVGLIRRSRSSGDGRRRYVHLQHGALDSLLIGPQLVPSKALFICSRNSARSQLAAAVWTSLAGARAESAGTHPADRVHPGAVAAARRAGLHLSGSAPRALSAVRTMPSIVVTVCDQAHEELPGHGRWLHWSIVDPVERGTTAAFDEVVVELRRRIGALLRNH